MKESGESKFAARWLGAGVDRGAVIGWLLAFTAFEWLRIKLDITEPIAGLSDALDAFTAVEMFEIAMLARLFLRRPATSPLSALEAAATVAGAAAIMLIVDAKPVFAAGLLSLYVLVRFAPNRADRPLALALFAFIAQYWLQAGPFIWLHEAVGTVDAQVLRWALGANGHAVGGSGTIVAQLDGSFAVDVLVGCSSSFVVSIVVPAFAIALLGLRGGFLRSDLLSLAGLIAATVLLNWIRLYPTSLSHEGWLYWHEGQGASFIAVANALLIALFVHLALRRDGRHLAAAA